MAEKNDVYGLEMEANADGINAVSKALDDVENKAEKAEGGVRKLGAQTDQCGAKASNLGTTWGDVGKAFGSRISAPFTKVFKSIGDKTKAFGTQFKQTTRNIGNFIKHPIQGIKVGLIGALTKTKDKTKEVEDSAKDMGSQLEDAGSDGENGLKKILGALKMIAVAALALKAVQAVTAFVKDAVGASEAMKTSTASLDAILGENAAAANEWAANYGKAANRSTAEVKGFMVESAAMYKTMGLNSEAVAHLSESTTALGYDLAAAFNVKDDAEMMGALNAAIGGSEDAMSKYGVQLDDATLKRTAASMGIKGEISELDDAVAAQVRYQAILEQTKDKQLGAFNAAGDYTNGIKSIKGVMNDFMTNIGGKFSNVLGGLFDKILESWPKIEKPLMNLMDMLSEGLGEIGPQLIEMAVDIIPVLADTIGDIFAAIKPLIPVILELVTKLLPPIMQIFSKLISSLIPPLVKIIDILIDPLMEIVDAVLPPLFDLIDALLPPLMDLIDGILPPIMDFVVALIPPIMEIISAVLPPLVDIINILLPPLIDIVNAILPPLLEIINMLLPPLLDIVNAVMPIIQDVLQALMPIITKLVESLMPVLQTILSAIEPILSAIAPIVEVLGTALGVVIDAISWIVDKVLSAGMWVLSLFGIETGGTEGTEIPSNAMGTENFEGGWTHINELGGEMAFLPKGSQIIPADKSQQMADTLEAATDTATTSGGANYNITVPITIQGNVDTTVLATIEAQIKAAVKQAIEDVQQKEYNDRMLQGAYT